MKQGNNYKVSMKEKYLPVQKKKYKKVKKEQRGQGVAQKVVQWWYDEVVFVCICMFV